ncbi:DNA translocase FtsK [candidate division WWE3 bacterium CG10_big_fil_rev_8_21_14_0_10_32_10]|uniref:DNA translocase FtsK n=1 Tax=candidate division WWE3 bacterium CG10_big_fil_rev_8_21_14_0_10_32_10 TaxID=1975090 RepID=A0A2H0R9G6_UNCKA|nr:MAG: DNA translocase FtsK [candidate division WWE3 bacterium CG10_big_fil_rev_8_21_14_0_10_32_10]
MGRKKKEEKKEYLYLNIVSILCIFLGILIVIVDIQPQQTPLKLFLISKFGISTAFLGVFFLVFGVYLNPLIKIKFINKRVLGGFLFLFLSSVLSDGLLGNKSFIGNLLYDLFSSFVGKIGTVVIILMFIFISLYLILNSKFISFIIRFFEGIRNIRSLNIPFVSKKVPEGGIEGNLDKLSKVEEELFDPENVSIDDITTASSVAPSDLESDAYRVVDSLSEPISLVKSGDKSSANSKSVVSSIGSLSNSSDASIEGNLYNGNMSENLIDSKLHFRNSIWEYPPLTLLNDGDNIKADTGDTTQRRNIIERTLNSFGIKAQVVDVNTGPAVTQYALRVDEGVKTSRITNLQSDLALSLASPNGQVRIEAPIPGKSLIGVEVPNISQETVFLKPMLNSSEYKKAKEKSKLSICLGKDVSGIDIFYPLNKMPHLLVAGATGSGKSIMIHSILTTLLFNNSPDECKLILVDPKRVELGSYKDIPHLITPVITEPSEAVNALKWVVGEMERRLHVLSSFGARNIDAYNEKSGFQAMPYIVVILDELADLMMTASNEVEKHIVRIAQLSRATGIHLVLATQRPSTDIITGSIKANVPARIAFSVASQIDSRVIIDTAGAEKLLGRGDMLFVSPESSKPKRIQGVWAKDDEVNRLVSFLKASDIDPEYNDEVVSSGNSVSDGSSKSSGGWNDDLFPEAVKTVVEEGKGSASLLQRRLSIGYARAARLLDELEENGVVGASDGSKPRDVLIDSPDDVLS